MVKLITLQKKYAKFHDFLSILNVFMFSFHHQRTYKHSDTTSPTVTDANFTKRCTIQWADRQTDRVPSNNYYNLRTVLCENR